MIKSGLLHFIVATLLLGSVCAQSFLYSVTLSDSNGQIIPLNTTFASVQIGLWSSLSGGGAASYTENFGNVPVTNGVFEIFDRSFIDVECVNKRSYKTESLGNVTIDFNCNNTFSSIVGNLPLSKVYSLSSDKSCTLFAATTKSK